ncbi:MAG: hypothetical protein IKT56_01525 [Clostridia bacterium]|nr:hypothetical protein [Clostridia bacterium]
MYYRDTQQAYQNNYQDTGAVLESLKCRFAGRGLAMQARSSANSYGNDGAYAYRSTSSQPLTLGEFEQSYRAHSGYRPITNVQQKMNARPVSSNQRTSSSRSYTNNVNNENARRANSVRAASGNSSERNLPQKKEEQKVPVSKLRRAVEREASKMTAPVKLLSRNFRSLPISAMLTVVICAVSLMFIVGSSVLLSDASNDYVNMQNEIASLAKQEDELLIALESKNDLRAINDIAVNKLGMVKKDLVSRQYIKLGDEDKIETFEDNNDTSVGLSTILSAIRGGN